MHTLAIECLDDPRVADYRDVRDADLRLRDGLFLTEGRLNVKRLITASPYRTRSVFVTEMGMRSHQRPRWSSSTPRHPCTWRRGHCSPPWWAMRCIAAAWLWANAGRSPRSRSCSRARQSLRTLVVLEDVSNPENVGSVFRNALALGADAVVLTRRCVDPLYRRSIRVSMGASLRLRYARTEDGPGALAALRARGFHQRRADGRAPAPTSLAGGGAAPPRLALWLGSEGERALRGHARGCRPERDDSDGAGRRSLNVATACGIALHHYRAVAGLG